MKKYYTVKQAAQVLGVSTNTIYKYLKSGELVSQRIGKGRIRIPSEAVTPFLQTESKVDISELDYKPVNKRNIVLENKGFLVPKDNDTIFYNIFESLLVVGLGVTLLLDGIVANVHPFASLFLISVVFAVTSSGLVRLLSLVFKQLNSYARLIEIFMLVSGVAYLSLPLVVGRSFGHSFMMTFVIYLFIRTLLGRAGVVATTSLKKFAFFALVMAVVGGLTVLIVPSKFPIQEQIALDWIANNRLLFSFIWFVIFIPFLTYVVSPLTDHSKAISTFFSFGGIVSIVFATELSIHSRMSEAYATYLLAVFILFIGFWSISNFRIKRTQIIPLIAGLFWIAATIIAGLASMRAIQSGAISKNKETLDTSLSQTTAHFEKIFKNNTSEMVLAARKADIYSVVSNKKTMEARDIIRALIQDGSFIRGGIVMAGDGLAVGSYPRNALIEGANFSSRDYFEKTNAAGDGYVSDVFVNALGSPAIVHIEPFYSNNEISSLIVSSLALKDLSVHYRNFAGKDSRIVVEDRKGNIVVDSADFDNIGTSFSEFYSKTTNAEIFLLESSKEITSVGWTSHIFTSRAPVLHAVSYASIFLGLLLSINALLTILSVLVISKE